MDEEAKSILQVLSDNRDFLRNKYDQISQKDLLSRNDKAKILKLTNMPDHDDSADEERRNYYTESMKKFNHDPAEIRKREKPFIFSNHHIISRQKILKTIKSCKHLCEPFVGS